MKVAVLLNRDHPHLRTVGKQALSRGYELVRRRDGGSAVLPKLDGFDTPLDPDPRVLLGVEVDGRARG